MNLTTWVSTGNIFTIRWTEHLKVHKAQDPKEAEEKVIILNLNINFNIKFISAIGS